MMKILNIIAMALVISSCAKKSMSERGDWVVKKVIRKIELDNMQAAKLWAVKHKYFEIRVAKKKERDAHFNNLLTLVKAKDISKQELKDYIKVGRKMADEYIPEVFPLVKDLHQSLSQKQKDEIANWANQLRKRFDL